MQINNKFIDKITINLLTNYLLRRIIIKRQDIMSTKVFILRVYCRKLAERRKYEADVCNRDAENDDSNFPF